MPEVDRHGFLLVAAARQTMSDTNGAPAPDAIDQAITRTEGAGPGVRIEVTLASGRIAVLGVPADISDVEVLSLIGSVLEARDHLNKARQEASRLVRAPAMPGLRS